MNLILKIAAVFFISMGSSCDSAKSSVAEGDSEAIRTKEMETKLKNEGYLAATVKYQADSKCTYVLIDETTDVKYDPINLDEAKFMSFKKDLEKVYFKYRALRMMNRCEDAQPVELEDIKKRED